MAPVTLLSRMAGDLEQRGSLRTSTATTMWGTYAVHAAATVAALGRPATTRTGTTVLGTALATAGVTMCVIGMRRFSGLPELTGTSTEPLVTGGVYRVSRNPQYAGYILALSGAAVVRRSPAALALTGVGAGAYRAWVPLEEAHLRRTLGEPYVAYVSRTPRWLGLPRDRHRR